MTRPGRHTPPHGFSLIEAVIATALLALICVACMPLLRAAADATSFAGGPRADRVLLARLADRVALAPSEFGIDEGVTGEIAVLWPEELRADAEGRPIEVPEVLLTVIGPSPGEGVGPDGEAPLARWLVLRADGETLTRWCTVPRRTDAVRQRRMALGRRTRITRRPTRIGMTLVETLVALAITSALATALFAWTATAARVAHASVERASREATVEAVLRGIQDDLLCRDSDAGTRGVGRRPVSLDGGSLVIRTRAGSPERRGPIVRRYRFDASGGTLDVEETAIGRSAAVTRSTLARAVDRFDVALSEKGEELTVTIALGGGDPVVRRFQVLP
jgi:type II secretory pathway component PulJ